MSPHYDGLFIFSCQLKAKPILLLRPPRHFVYITLSFSEGVTRHKLKGQTTEVQTAILFEMFLLGF